MKDSAVGFWPSPLPLLCTRPCDVDGCNVAPKSKPFTMHPVSRNWDWFRWKVICGSWRSLTRPVNWAAALCLWLGERELGIEIAMTHYKRLRPVTCKQLFSACYCLRRLMQRLACSYRANFDTTVSAASARMSSIQRWSINDVTQTCCRSATAIRLRQWLQQERWVLWDKW